MKKFFVFLCIALAFIMVFSTFLSIGKILENDSEETEEADEAGPQEGLFYTSDGSSYTLDQLKGLSDGTYVYYVEGNVTRFAKVFTTLSNTYAVDFNYRTVDFEDYKEYFCSKLLKVDGSYELAAGGFDIYMYSSECILPHGYDRIGSCKLAKVRISLEL